MNEQRIDGEIQQRLQEIVGERYVSDCAEERFIYSRDMGTMEPSAPDLVVMPGSKDDL